MTQTQNTVIDVKKFARDKNTKICEILKRENEMKILTAMPLQTKIEPQLLE